MAKTFRNVTYNNEVSYFIDGENIFPAIMNLLEEAHRSIYLEVFLFNDDEAGNAITDKLIQKARAGVDVRVLISDKGLQLNDSFAMFERMEKNNVKLCATFPLAKDLKDLFEDIRWISKGAADRDHEIFELRFNEEIADKILKKAGKKFEKVKKKLCGGKFSQWLSLGSLKRRKKKILNSFRFYDHRKIFVVDNLKAIVGGMNIANDYLFQGNPSVLGYFHDIAVLISGKAVNDIARIFVEMWDVYNTDRIDLVVSKETQEEGNGEIEITSLASFPRLVPNPIRMNYIEAIKSAAHSVYLVNLFISDQEILRELINTRARGVDVHIISTYMPVPQLKTIFNRIIYNGYYFLIYHKHRLQDHGIRLHHYTEHQVHAKVGMVDDSWLTVGSSNLDYSSLKNASEINISFRYAPLIENIKKALFLRDIKNSRILDGQRSIFRKIYYYFCYVIYITADKYFM